MTSPAAVFGLLAMLVATVAVGVFARRFARTTSDFLVAARAVRPTANAAAISGEYLSAASFLGIAGLVMKFGYDVLWYPVGYAAGYLVLLVFIAGPLRRFGAYTIPDFAEGRFNSPALRSRTARRPRPAPRRTGCGRSARWPGGAASRSCSPTR
jgi:Na+(H+)/acetate symporter ActP